MNDTSEGNDHRSPVLSDALLVAAVPIVGYGIAVAYKYGYVTAFAVPVDYISLQASDVFIAMTLVLLGLSSAWAVMFLFQHAMEPTSPGATPSEARHEVNLLLRPPVTFFAAVVPFLFLFRAPVAAYPVALLLACLMTALPELFTSYLFGRRHRGFVAKMQQSRSSSTSNPIEKIVGQYGKRRVLLVLLAFYAIIIATAAGYATARQTEVFLVTAEATPRAVLVLSGTTGVLATFNAQSGVLGNDRQLVKLDDPDAPRVQWALLPRLHAERAQPI